LILLDEVGRGTATYDGISIAWAIAEYIHNEIRSKTLFATHYHELNELASRYDNIANYRVEALETGGTVIFTHKVMKGGSDHSFGIHVAQMAGIPMDVIERSKEIMATLEKDDEPSNNKKSLKPKSESLNAIDIKRKAAQSTQMSIFEFHDDELRSRIASIDLNQLTPLKAFQILTEIYMEIKRAQQ
jgi:DNA mismatch repair protein MutS